MADFRAQTLYFVVLDRFFNSDPSNDSGRAPGLYDSTRTDWLKYWGGDLGGLLAKLDYLQALGVGAVWITPVFDQVDGLTDAEGRGQAAYHGYWAKDFRRIDEHLVSDPADVRIFTRQDTVFDRLVREMERRGMTLVLDVVCNHSSPAIARHKGALYDDGEFLTSWEDDKLGWYNRAGGITDWKNRAAVQSGELCGLADFNENVHSFRTYIQRVMRDWLDRGVGALRVDTVKHMPLWFWQEWTSELRAHRPGLFLVGEWYQGGCWDPDSIEFANRAGMTIFDFSLQRALEDALARGAREGFRLVQAVFDQDARFCRATHLVTFVDNHDMPRFLSVGGGHRRLEQATLLILVARGIPCIYYGDEQYLHDDTGGGADPYNRPMMKAWDTSTAFVRQIRALSDLRKANPAIQRGSHQERWVDEDTYVFERIFGASVCLAAFRRGGPKNIGPIRTGLPEGTHRCVLTGRAVEVRKGQIESLELASDDVWVLSTSVEPPPQQGTRMTFQLNGYSSELGERVVVVGNRPELGAWDAHRAPALHYVNANLWEGDVDLEMTDAGLVRYRYAILREGSLPRFENLLPRRMFVPKAGTETRRDFWER